MITHLKYAQNHLKFAMPEKVKTATQTYKVVGFKYDEGGWHFKLKGELNYFWVKQDEVEIING